MPPEGLAVPRGHPMALHSAQPPSLDLDPIRVSGGQLLLLLGMRQGDLEHTVLKLRADVLFLDVLPDVEAAGTGTGVQTLFLFLYRPFLFPEQN